MRCVIVQPSYIPWRGYFDLIHRADVFVFYDDVQYDKHGWRNRNRVKTRSGTQWLTIPVQAGGVTIDQTPINQIEMANATWARKHFRTLSQLYGGAPYFDLYRDWLADTYASPPALLSEFTIGVTMAISQRLGITTTRFLRSSELHAEGTRTDRLISILKQIGATQYLSGPTAKAYIERGKFVDAGIELQWIEYAYPEYPQLYPPYDPYVTILDLLFMTGSEAPQYIWGEKARPGGTP